MTILPFFNKNLRKILKTSWEINLKRLAIAFTGQSNSGKTTLIEKVATILINDGFKVCIMKHDPKDKAIFDVEGKDSDRFTKTGASVAVLSPNRTTVFKNQTSTLEEVIAMFGDFDYLLVEGLKWLDLPRICIARDVLNFDYFECSDVLAVANVQFEQIPNNMKYFDLNDPQLIINWINTNAKRV